MSEPLVQCNCCDYFSLPPDCGWEICAVCFWQHDGFWGADPDKVSGANRMTLREGRANYVVFGACDERFKGRVVPPEKRLKFRYVAREL